MKYFLFGLVLLAVVVSIKSRSISPNEPCNDGETTSFDGCNTCVCGKGNWACTLKLCLPEEDRPKRDAESECTPNEHKQEDCNTCFCTETGIWACTKIGCN